MTEYDERYESTGNGKGTRWTRRRAGIGIAAVGLAGVLAAGSGLFFARHAGAGHGHGAWCAAEGDDACGQGRSWKHGFGHGRHHRDHDPEEVRERIGFVSDRVLGYVDASEQQRVAIDGILDRSVEEGFTLMGEREGLHERLSVLLTASEVDRDALEALRARQIELADAVSRQLTNHLAEIAEVLTPEQRGELAELHERFRR